MNKPQITIKDIARALGGGVAATAKQMSFRTF